MFINSKNKFKVMPAKTSEVTRIRLKHKGKIHLKNFYVMMHEWLIHEGWASRDDKNFPEIFSGRNDAAGGGSEIWWFWRPKKRMNSFFEWQMDINGHVLTLRDIEEIKDGKKFKTNFGDVEIWIKVKLVLDPDDKWANHPFLKNFLGVYIKRMRKKDISNHQKGLLKEAYRFQDAMKSFMGLITANKEIEHQGRFFPEGGIGE